MAFEVELFTSFSTLSRVLKRHFEEHVLYFGLHCFLTLSRAVISTMKTHNLAHSSYIAIAARVVEQ